MACFMALLDMANFGDIRCFAFIGTISGAYHVAQAIMPERTLMLCPRAGEWQRLYRFAPPHILLTAVTEP